jgi:hypothetical protein
MLPTPACARFIARCIVHLGMLAFFFASVIAIACLLLIAAFSPPFEVSLTAFAVGGTMTALVLPAAELGGQTVRRVVEYWLDRVTSVGGSEARTRAQMALEVVTEARVGANAARRGSVYIVTGFLLSIIAMLGPIIPVVGIRLPVGPVFLAMSLAFLVVGSFMLLPFAWQIYQLREAEEAEWFFAATANAEGGQPGASMEADG